MTIFFSLSPKLAASPDETIPTFAVSTRVLALAPKIEEPMRAKFFLGCLTKPKTTSIAYLFFVYLTVIC